MSAVKLCKLFAGDILKCKINTTLHGRSRYHPDDKPGHNVVRGYKQPGKGDALDVFLPAGTPINTPITGTITRKVGPAGTLDCIYIEGVMRAHEVLVVLAHCHYKPTIVDGTYLTAGQVVGFVADEFQHTAPHLHLEIWVDGQALSADSPVKLAKLMSGYFV